MLEDLLADHIALKRKLLQVRVGLVKKK